MKRIILHELLKHMLSKASVGWMADTTQFPSYYMAFLHVYTGINHLLWLMMNFFNNSEIHEKILLICMESVRFRNAYRRYAPPRIKGPVSGFVGDISLPTLEC